MFELFELYGQPEHGECVACLTRRADIILVPCRHVCLCKACAETYHAHCDKCPMCRATVSKMLHT